MTPPGSLQHLDGRHIGRLEANLPTKPETASAHRLCDSESISARAVEYAILTAVHPSETMGAITSEFNLQERIWNVPADRAKPGRILRDPLSERAMQIVRELWPDVENAYIFPSPMLRRDGRGKRLSNNAMLDFLNDLDETECTVHGFRSSFRDWIGECTNFQREVSEAALGHIVGDESERAYRQGRALATRRRLMEAWARYCEPEKSARIVAVTG
jgi:integrase